MGRRTFWLAVLGFLAISIQPAQAEIATSENIMTVEQVKEKVERAAGLIEAEGEAAFPKLRDKNGEFWFGNGKGFVLVANFQGTMIVDAERPELEGTNGATLKDSSNFYFGLAVFDLVKKYGSGWVIYYWEKPGKKLTERKADYVKLVKWGEKEYVVGCGMYNVDKEFVLSKFPNDVIVTSDEKR